MISHEHAEELKASLPARRAKLLVGLQPFGLASARRRKDGLRKQSRRIASMARDLKLLEEYENHQRQSEEKE